MMNWIEKDNKLVKDFQFEDFITAFAFMTKVAFVAEKMGHHPEWSNVYNKVSIKLNTHDAGNIVTDLDRELAAKIDKFAS
jgi:4a-hydroxytetrahydrobiopterin dehydratase